VSAESWMYLSATVVAVSGFYYAFHAWRRNIYPNPVSWGVWVVVGIALFLTANTSQADAVYFTNIVAAWNPFLIATIILVRVRDRIYNLSNREKQCLVFAFVGYFLWFVLHDMPTFAPWAMYWMVGVDLFALWPTLTQVREKPMSDKPIPWMIFGLGFGLSGFAIDDHTIANWIIPTYMFLGANFVALPMIIYRVRNNSLWREWV